MRSFFYMWVLPMGLFVTWYGLAYNDTGGNIWLFSRALHDEVIGVYATPLGLDPADVPPLLLRALIVDTALVAAIMAFRYRKRWWPQFMALTGVNRTTAELEERQGPSVG